MARVGDYGALRQVQGQAADVTAIGAGLGLVKTCTLAAVRLDAEPAPQPETLSWQKVIFLDRDGCGAARNRRPARSRQLGADG